MRKTRLYISTGLNMLILTGVFLASAVALPDTVLAAACTTPATDYGSVSSTVNIPTAGTYRIWSRIQAPTSANNSYLLEIDGNTCFNVGGNASMPLNSWQWINYQNGNTGSLTSMNLTAGNHTVKMIGNKPDVLLDRVVFTQDTNCTPDHSFAGGVQPGDNCADPQDNAGPTLNITSPAAGQVSGANVAITATASDPSTVDKVEFFINNVSVRVDDTDNKASYTHTWNTTSGYPNGNYNIKVRATDKSGNANTTEKTVAVTVNNTVVRKPGDVNDDGLVNGSDLSTLAFNYGKTGMTLAQGDLSGDGKINGADLSILSYNWMK